MGNLRLMLLAVVVSGANIESRAAQSVTLDTTLQNTTVDSTYGNIAVRRGDQRKPLIPNRFELRQNYPNPFNPTTTIDFELPGEAVVYAVVYNILGQRTRTLLNEVRVPGRYSLVWDGRDDAGELVSGGVYFFRLLANGHQSIRKMLLLK